MAKPNHARLAKSPAYRPATESPAQAGLSISALVSTLAAFALAFAGAGGTAPPRAIHVGNDRELAAAVGALRDSGGTIVLQPNHYRRLVVPARPHASALLEIVGSEGVRIERVLLDGSRRVSIGRIAIVPRSQNASLEVRASSEIELYELLVTAQGTPYAASVVVPDSRGVRIRRSRFTHCGDRSPAWSNCLLLSDGANDLVVEDSRFHDCFGCDFIHGRFGTGLTVRRNRFERALPCRLGRVRCGHQDLIELFAGRRLRFEGNHFGVYRIGGAQLYLTGPMANVRIVNNVFVGTDPLVPRYRARVGLIVGSAYSRELPLDVTIANNTILTGARRSDGFAGSLRMSSVYGGLPKHVRPIVANNVIGLLADRWPVCHAARAFVANVVARGRPCSATDRVGDPRLDDLARPTDRSMLLIDRASRAYAPERDASGRVRRGRPDVGAYEYVGRR
jgi:hypothetical protein